jgi:hypothetical protein
MGLVDAAGGADITELVTAQAARRRDWQTWRSPAQRDRESDGLSG